MKKFKVRKLDNKGMSLVEVLVAMIIISIAGVTFLQSFNYSIKNNTKSREKQHALVLAQSMMETFKAYPIEELDKTTATSGPFSLYTLGTSVTPTVSGGVHTYKLQNVNFNGYKYDVMMEATASTSKPTSGKVAEIHNPDQTKDAVFKQDFYAEQDKVLQAVWDNIMSQKASYPGIENFLLNGYNDYSLFDKTLINIDSRTVTVSISGGKQVITNVSYNISTKAFSYIDDNGENQTFPAQSGISTIAAYNSGVFSNLKSVYAYYYPAYKADPAYVTDRWIMCTSDKISVVNNSSASVDIYLVKQELPSISTTVIQSFETMYHPTITGTGSVNLFTNVEKHLYDSTKTCGYTIVGFDEVTTELFKDETQELVYDVDIKVYKSGSSDVIYNLIGSTNYR